MKTAEISGFDRASGLVVIKPSGVKYDAMKPADMVVDLDSIVVEDSYKPSGDTATHLVLYRTWEKLGALCIRAPAGPPALRRPGGAFPP